MNAIDMEMVAARYPALVTRPGWQRLRIPVVLTVTTLYLLFSFWFFSFAQVFSTANWGIAGAYLADWVSYEERPDIRIEADGAMRVVFPNNSSLGADPHPDWLTKDTATITRAVEVQAAAKAAPAEKSSTFNFMAPDPAAVATPDQPVNKMVKTIDETVVTRASVRFSGSISADITATRVEIRNGGDTLTLPLGGADIQPVAPLPDWASQPYAGGKVIVSLGLPGWMEVEPDRVKIRKRFLGWANFIFDTNSRFFGRTTGEVVSLIASGPRLDPGQSNASLALNDVLYNPSWQHLDVWTKLLQTIVMAFVGTLFAAALSFPLAFVAARNITRSRIANQVAKRCFDFLRSVDMLIWALFFTRAFGPGPLAGMSAIFFTDTGTLGKLYSEALENIDNKPREGIRSVGAAAPAVHRFAIIPQVLPVFVSQALYFWESNTRSATIIGAVGAGGIGLKLWEAMRTNSDWENVAYMVILILIVVYIFDTLSNVLRSKLIGPVSR
ncbi:phosphonate ABC transporter, permease protein PhnE [Rhizobium sp. KVB221]|uniref:Phosphonate ABC transporter, permease protein PhnE n=2 Tax=Rhizobium setariae TaxID=2801340 RepID=A0A936YM27_9HYPH|nr:phosphonate ABC transporter, permease protein PhnE [Rhizobium setariae]MBL0372925.1 phosphonate ABC transporter, permease protein PhnE [Rhizobium setariae]